MSIISLIHGLICISPGIFEKNVLNKKYKGKSDRVALFQMFQEGWSKNLSKKK